MAVELDWPGWPGFSPKAMAELEAYDWPGNVRELRNVVERAVYRSEDPERAVDQIQFDPFATPWLPGATAAPAAAAPVSEAASADEPAQPAAAPGPAYTSDFRAAVTAYERALLEDALARNRYNQRATAAALSLSYDQLRHALKRHKLMDSEAA
jgi:psp operon transcriptional activator